MRGDGSSVRAVEAQIMNGEAATCKLIIGGLFIKDEQTDRFKD